MSVCLSDDPRAVRTSSELYELSILHTEKQKKVHSNVEQEFSVALEILQEKLVNWDLQRPMALINSQTGRSALLGSISYRQGYHRSWFLVKAWKWARSSGCKGYDTVSNDSHHQPFPHHRGCGGSGVSLTPTYGLSNCHTTTRLTNPTLSSSLDLF